MMRGRIDRLLFWAGGVILPRPSSLALRALSAPGRDPALEMRLVDLERQLALGELAPAAFCELAACAGGAPGMAGSLRQEMLAGAEILPGMAGLLEELAPRVRLALLSDYPEPWLKPVVSRQALARLLPAADIHYAAACRGADLFDALIAEDVIHPGHTLMIDHDFPRAAAAIRRGIDAAIFVDSRRLRRDLGLWGILAM